MIVKYRKELWIRQMLVFTPAEFFYMVMYAVGARMYQIIHCIEQLQHPFENSVQKCSTVSCICQAPIHC